ncbi:HAD family hydrolase [Streptomonospora wellingtoniae]|uniref:HAD family phosphatase n=1 Tax=Streptomonospora wellingtoniae TaxID=3075544 RepID=A0ABU2KSW7_9ACTN|nr:HAD family phosphatase [Streptomonospora sp. DSM 45055]MDT0302380.1 HAD family phosphatase [Streptomonospora sp. DSM 45055]
MGVSPPDAPGDRPGIEAVICDYGGVLTNPLAETYTALADKVGIPFEDIAAAFAAATARYGHSPMAALEVGEITEREMVARVAAELPPGAPPFPDDVPFGDLWFAGRTGNREFVSFLRTLKGRVRLALLTNNVVEWERHWRATIPVDELFEVVVNSAHEGVRKPAPEIYHRTLQALGTHPGRCLFVDDVEANLAVARELGIATVHFTSTPQAVAGIRAALAPAPGDQR